MSAPATNQPDARVVVGRSPRVHGVRVATIYTRHGYMTTHCGFYGKPQPGGWMRYVDADVTCKRCEKAISRASSPLFGEVR